MSDTPRTDRMIDRLRTEDTRGMSSIENFARQLERELATMTADRNDAMALAMNHEGAIARLTAERDALQSAYSDAIAAQEARFQARVESDRRATATALAQAEMFVAERDALRAVDAGHLSRIDGLKTRVEALTAENEQLRALMREIAEYYDPAYDDDFFDGPAIRRRIRAALGEP